MNILEKDSSFKRNGEFLFQGSIRQKDGNVYKIKGKGIEKKSLPEGLKKIKKVVVTGATGAYGTKAIEIVHNISNIPVVYALRDPSKVNETLQRSDKIVKGDIFQGFWDLDKIRKVEEIGIIEYFKSFKVDITESQKSILEQIEDDTIFIHTAAVNPDPISGEKTNDDINPITGEAWGIEEKDERLQIVASVVLNQIAFYKALLQKVSEHKGVVIIHPNTIVATAAAITKRGGRGKDGVFSYAKMKEAEALMGDSFRPEFRKNETVLIENLLGLFKSNMSDIREGKQLQTLLLSKLITQKFHINTEFGPESLDVAPDYKLSKLKALAKEAKILEKSIKEGTPNKVFLEKLLGKLDEKGEPNGEGAIVALQKATLLDLEQIITSLLQLVSMYKNGEIDSAILSHVPTYLPKHLKNVDLYVEAMTVQVDRYKGLVQKILEGKDSLLLTVKIKADLTQKVKESAEIQFAGESMRKSFNVSQIVGNIVNNFKKKINNMTQHVTEGDLVDLINSVVGGGAMN